MTEIEQLHDAVFGFVPDKQGTAYERITAIALAAMGWTDVVHDIRAVGAGRTAVHQLDVEARHPDGTVRRLIVECKSGGEVGKDQMDLLVGVRAQLGADAALLMTPGRFTRGARAVAADEDIAMVVLRPFDNPKDWAGFVKTIHLRIKAYGSTITRMEPIVADPVAAAELLGENEHMEMRLSTDTPLELADGAPVETIADILSPHRPGMVEGEFELEARVSGDRHLPLGDGQRLRIAGFRWTEVSGSTTTEQVIEGEGQPVLKVEQLEADGSVASGRLIIDRDLHSWDIDAEGRVIERGPLLPPAV